MKLTLRYCCYASKFVPKSSPLREKDVLLLQEFLNNSKNLLIITGAGISTESGIPDYRSEGVGLYARTNRRPIMHQEFMSSSYARLRYWARNYVGWPEFSSRQANAGHRAIANWQGKKKLLLVTQNVDGLHTKAGSDKVIELHGNMHKVICMKCNHLTSREEMQVTLDAMNHSWLQQLKVDTSSQAPDGDVLINDVAGFKVPACKLCGGILKPDVVFFGANVLSKIVDDVMSALDACDSLLVCGSSLCVFSGFRFVSRANDLGKWIGIVNIGSTRADPITDIKIESACGLILPKMIL